MGAYRRGTEPTPIRARDGEPDIKQRRHVENQSSQDNVCVKQLRELFRCLCFEGRASFVADVCVVSRTPVIVAILILGHHCSPKELKEVTNNLCIISN